MHKISAFCLAAGLILAGPPVRAEDQALTLAAPPGELHGTYLPSGRNAPVVLIIAGSGPTDRDGNSALGLHSNSYRLLAEALATKGIASFRYDKRGVGESKSALAAQRDLRIQTYSGDAAAWLAPLRKQTGAKCIWLLGHSEGALLAEIVAQKAQGICGLVLVSGAGRKIGEVMREQMSAMPEPAKSQAFAALAELEAGRLVPDPPRLPPGLFYADIQPFLISWLPLDPAALLAAIHLPVLILQGDTDIQVSVEDAKRLATAKPDAKLEVLTGVNHILKLAPADRAANAATYVNPSLPLATSVVDAVADFVHTHSR